jgi:hypothetical protein
VYIVWSCRCLLGLAFEIYGRSLIRYRNFENFGVAFSEQKYCYQAAKGNLFYNLWIRHTHILKFSPLPCCCFDKLLFLTVLEYFQLLSWIKCLHSLSPSHSFSQQVATKIENTNTTFCYKDAKIREENVL